MEDTRKFIEFLRENIRPHCKSTLEIDLHMALARQSSAKTALDFVISKMALLKSEDLDLLIDKWLCMYKVTNLPAESRAKLRKWIVYYIDKATLEINNPAVN